MPNASVGANVDQPEGRGQATATLPNPGVAQEPSPMVHVQTTIPTPYAALSLAMAGLTLVPGLAARPTAT